jgi:parallel beta-helix repeat protein
MQRKIIAILVINLLIITVISGCIEEKKSSVNKVEIVGKGTYITIQKAINAASSGDTINVNKGTYYESLIINKSINLIGEGKEKTFIDYRKIESGNIIIINNDNCIIDGFTITNSIYDTNETGFIKGITISSSGNKISNNIISKTSFGIEVTNSKNNMIINNTFFENQNGIELLQSTNNEIIYNNISLSSHYGIVIFFESEYNNVSYNTFKDNNEAVHLKDVMYNRITKNILYNNTKKIEECCGAINNEISENIYR